MPPGIRSEFKSAGDLFTWMENTIENNDAQKRPYLSAQRLDKLSGLLGNTLVGAAATLDVLAKYSKSGNY